jgi:E3 ubiquitin-protein ligase HUWE1
VTLENRKEFVQLSAQYRLYSSIKEQIEFLLGGFCEIVLKDMVSIVCVHIFLQSNEQEVELLISGTLDIDVDEWRAATEYNGYTSSGLVIVWWWWALDSSCEMLRQQLLLAINEGGEGFLCLSKTYRLALYCTPLK